MQEDFAALGPKDLLHPLLTTLGTFEVSGPCSRHSGSQQQDTKESLNQRGTYQKNPRAHTMAAKITSRHNDGDPPEL